MDTRFRSDAWNHAWRLLLPAVGSLLISATSTAQNIVANPRLASDLAPWTIVVSTAPDPPATGTAQWTEGINNGNVEDGTGSACIQLDPQPGQPANAFVGIRQCVALPTAPVVVTSASYGAHFLAPVTGNPSDGMADAVIELRFFSDASCTSYIPGTGGSQGYWLAEVALSDTLWYEIGDSRFELPSAPTASSAEIVAVVRTFDTTDNGYHLCFDQFRVLLNGSIFDDGFESGDTTLWTQPGGMVQDPCHAITLAPTNVPPAHLSPGVTYGTRVSASPLAYYDPFISQGILPSGINLTDSYANHFDLAGQVAELGTFVFSGTASDPLLGCQGGRSYSIEVFECGDGSIDLPVGEVCDDGDNISGDGCSADCLSDETCGNDIVDVAEECDSLNLNGADCTTLGLLNGTLTCNPVTCLFDTSGCETCGNGTIEAGEQCDGTDLQGFDCQSLGLSGGTLACDPDSCTFDTSGCFTSLP